MGKEIVFSCACWFWSDLFKSSRILSLGKLSLIVMAETARSTYYHSASRYPFAASRTSSDEISYLEGRVLSLVDLW